MKKLDILDRNKLSKFVVFSLGRDKNNKFFHIESEFDLQDFDDYPTNFQSTHVSSLHSVSYAKETPGSL